MYNIVIILCLKENLVIIMASNVKMTGSMQTVKSLVFHCIIRAVLASILAFIIYMSITVIAVGMGTKDIGYTVLYSEDGENYTEVYTHYYADGDDAQLAKYENNDKYYKTLIHSQLPTYATALVRWTGQAATLILLFAMVYGFMWHAGDSDANKCELGKQPRHILKGLKVGLIADIPYALLYLGLIITYLFNKSSGYTRIYKIATYFMYAFNDTFIKTGKSGFILNIGSVIGCIVVLLPIPLFCTIGYIIGEKHIILKDKIIYKQNKE